MTCGEAFSGVLLSELVIVERSALWDILLAVFAVAMLRTTLFRV